MAEDGRIVAVACGSGHSLALYRGGGRDTLLVFGQGEDGQLGLGDCDERHLPAPIRLPDASLIKSISCGAEHTVVVLDESKKVFSWGEGDFGRLGNGENSDVSVPKGVPGLHGVSVAKIFCGDAHCMAILEGVGMLGFGRNQFGQLGIGNTDDSLVPVPLPAFAGLDVVDAACGAEHSVAVTSSGDVYAWGWGNYGPLGLGDRSHRTSPHKLQPFHNDTQEGIIVKVACGWRHSAAITEKGTLYTCGWSKYGQLGHGDNHDRLTMVRVEALKDLKVTKCVGGWRHTMAITDKGEMYAWGWNRFGQLGLGTALDTSVATRVTALEKEKVVNMAAGWRHTIAITESSRVYSWGRGASGQLGHGDSSCLNLPKPIAAVDELLAHGLAALQGGGIEAGPEAPEAQVPQFEDLKHLEQEHAAKRFRAHQVPT